MSDWPDWKTEHPLPWRVQPRSEQGKYYSTKILDANGEEVAGFRVWDNEPSAGEIEYWSGDRALFDEEGRCDSHWETEGSVKFCEWLVKAANSTPRE